MLQIELNKLIEISMPPSDVIPEEAQQRIRNSISWWGYPSLPSDWLWHWSINSKERSVLGGNYVGTLTKRISSYYYQEHGVNIDKKHLETLGTYASKGNTGETFIFQFVNRFNWEAGQFGDHNSCYFVRTGMPLKVLEDNNILAACFYRSHSEDDEGIFQFVDRQRKQDVDVRNQMVHRSFGFARAWVRPNFPEQGMLTVFNGYGFTGDSLLKIARILSTHFSMNYKQVIAYNQGRMNGIVYVNVGTRYQIVNGERKKVQKPRAVILGTNDQLSHYPYESTILELDIKDSSSYYDDTDLEI